MSVFRSRPALRWLVPSAAAVVVIGGGAAAGTIVASADPSLPARSAAQLLVDLQNAKVAGLSGTVVESADLGLPSIVSAAAGASGSASPLANLVAGSNTVRVWYAGQDKNRLALLGTGGESDVIHNGRDVWAWQSSTNSGTHVKLPADQATKTPSALPGDLPSTPAQAAAQALALIDPTTKVSTTGAAKVAGRDAYELVLTPKDSASLIGQVRLAIDAEKHIPLRVDVYAKNATNPAVRVAFQQISFTVPDAQEFTFTAPPGAKMTESSPDAVAQQHKDATQAEKARVATDEPKVIGTGWTSVVTTKLPTDSKAKSSSDSAQYDQLLTMLPAASGTWGKGHIFAGTLFSVLITDSGQVYAGAVTPETLYQAVGK